MSLIVQAPAIVRMRSTNPNHLERWLGRAEVDKMSRAMSDWYGPPIAVGGVPGAVHATRGGDFVGECRHGREASVFDYLSDFKRRLDRALRITSREHRSQLNAGFASLSDIVKRATADNSLQMPYFQKAGPTGVASVTSTLWRVGSQPSAGAAGSAAPGGRAPTSSTAGAIGFTNAPSTEFTSFISAAIFGSVVSNTLLLYDRLFDVAKTMSSSATEAVTGVPTRYQSTTSTDPDYIAGNFGFIEIFAALSATAHNWTTCLYKNQAGTGSQTLPSVTGNSSGIIDRLDQPVNTWFTPLAAGDTGIAAWGQMQCSSASVTGNINFCIGHPIAWCPILVANMAMIVDGINTAFSLTRIFDNACLAFLEVMKPTTAATNYGGTITTLAG